MSGNCGSLAEGNKERCALFFWGVVGRGVLAFVRDRVLVRTVFFRTCDKLLDLSKTLTKRRPPEARFAGGKESLLCASHRQTSPMRNG